MGRAPAAQTRPHCSTAAGRARPRGTRARSAPRAAGRCRRPRALRAVPRCCFAARAGPLPGRPPDVAHVARSLAVARRFAPPRCHSPPAGQHAYALPSRRRAPSAPCWRPAQPHAAWCFLRRAPPRMQQRRGQRRQQAPAARPRRPPGRGPAAAPMGLWRHGAARLQVQGGRQGRCRRWSRGWRAGGCAAPRPCAASRRAACAAARRARLRARRQREAAAASGARWKSASTWTPRLS